MSDSVFRVLIPCITAAAVLLGVIVSELFSRWKRREQYKGIVFNKKLEFYQALVGMTIDITMEFHLAVENKTKTNELPDRAAKLMDFFNSHFLLASLEVTRLVADYWKTAVTSKGSDSEFKDAISKLSSIHLQLRERCQRELGLKALEKDIAKMAYSDHGRG